MANLLMEQGNYEEARPYMERALAIREKVLGEEHPETAVSLNNLANLLYAQGSYEEARRFYERALTIREKVLGEEHPETADSLFNLGTVLRRSMRRLAASTSKLWPSTRRRWGSITPRPRGCDRFLGTPMVLNGDLNRLLAQGCDGT